MPAELAGACHAVPLPQALKSANFCGTALVKGRAALGTEFAFMLAMSFGRAKWRDADLLRTRIAALVASCSAAACSPATSGSQDSPVSLADPEIGRDAPSSEVCNVNAYALVSGLHLPNPVHYLARDYSGAPMEQAGTACEAADDPEACASALAAIRTEASASPTAATFGRFYYVYTRGSEVDVVVSEQEVLEFLGPIDTANEAAIVLSLKYGMTRCSDLDAALDGYLTGPNYYHRQLTPATPGMCETIGVFAVHVAHDGATTELQREVIRGTCPGRSPAGLLALAGSAWNLAAGAHFAHVAQLELAAVAAFAEIERALAAHGAPQHLLERCRAARRDEVRHAALMTELACRYGVAPEPVRFVPKASHTLLELALENAREGTSRELFGAALAAWQSRAADAGDTRARYAEIARDEAEHAQLSRDLAAWLSERLSEAERRLVEHERERSFRELDLELDEVVDDEVALVAGLPNASDAKRLLRALRAELA
jgi:hypothetical protein